MSSAFDAQPGECAETSGFLFSHKCGEMAVQKCSGCNKYICARHSVTDQQRLLCTSCAKGQLNSQAPNRYDDNDPYFYSSVYYPSYHQYRFGQHYNRDFNESDEQALEGKPAERSDVQAFENDVGAS